jgi:hypothetical protein
MITRAIVQRGLLCQTSRKAGNRRCVLWNFSFNLPACIVGIVLIYMKKNINVEISFFRKIPIANFSQVHKLP